MISDHGYNCVISAVARTTQKFTWDCWDPTRFGQFDLYNYWCLKIYFPTTLRWLEQFFSLVSRMTSIVEIGNDFKKEIENI